MTTLIEMPKKRPDSNQLAAIIVAKAAGIDVPQHAKEFEHYVRKTTGQTTKPKATKKQRK